MQKLRFINGNGTEIDLTAGRFGITEWNGFSNADLNIQSQQVPFQDGAVFLDALYNPRELSVTVAINDDNDLEKRYELKRELISAMNAKLGEGYLYYKNDFIEKRIKVVPQLPIFENKNSNDSGTLKASLTWNAPEVYWEDVNNIVIDLKKNTVVNIENKGDIKSQIIVDVVNQGQESSTIENIVTRKKITVNSNKNFTINTSAGNKSIKENSSEFVRTAFNITSSANKNDVYLYGGDWLYHSSDNISLVPINSIELGNETHVFYSELFQKFIILSRKSIYFSDDGVNFTRTFYNPQMSNTFDNEFYENNVWLVTRNSGYNYLYKRKSLESNWDNITFPHNTTNKKLITKNGNIFIVMEFYNNVSYIYETEDFSTFTLKLELEFQVTAIEFYSDNLYLSDGTNIYKYNLSYSQVTSWQVANVNYFYVSKNKGLLAGGMGLYMLETQTSSWRTISDNISVKNIIDFKDDVFVSSTSGCYKILGYELELKNSSDSNIINCADIILWLSNLYSFDGDLWFNKNLSCQGVNVVEFKQKLYAWDGNKIKLSLDGYNFSTIKEETSSIDKLISTPNYLVRKQGMYSGKSLDGINWEDFIITSNPDYSIYDLCYSEDLNCFVAVGYGGIWYSEDLENWNQVYSSNRNFWKVIYDKKRKLFWVTLYNSNLRQGMYGFSQDGINWDIASNFLPQSQDSQSIAISDDGTIVCGQIDGVSYMTPEMMYFDYKQIDSSIIVPSSHTDLQSTVFYSKILKLFFLIFYNGHKVYSSSDGINWSVYMYSNSIFNSESEFHNIIYSEDFILKLISGENLISDLSPDSDIDFNLDLGDNYILPNFNGSLIFRQKYLGV